MKKRRWLLIFLVVAVIGGLAWLVLHGSPGPPDPEYKGKRLSEWIAVYDPANTNRPAQLMSDTQFAIRGIGTNSIPYLLGMLERSDSPLKIYWMTLVQKQSLVKVEYIPEMNRCERAASALQVLGREAKDVVPELVRIYDLNPSVHARNSISRVLGQMGPDARAAVPSLLRGLTEAGTNTVARANAISALGWIHSDPDKVVPVLINALQDPDFITRIVALSGLRSFGPEARTAVPALIKFLEKNPLPQIASARLMSLNEGNMAAGALRAIDPATAATVLTNSPTRESILDLR